MPENQGGIKKLLKVRLGCQRKSCAWMELARISTWSVNLMGGAVPSPRNRPNGGWQGTRLRSELREEKPGVIPRSDISRSGCHPLRALENFPTHNFPTHNPAELSGRNALLAGKFQSGRIEVGRIRNATERARHAGTGTGTRSPKEIPHAARN